MNGVIAQLVALACHANAFLRGHVSSQRYFPANSTCQFCDRTSFAEFTKREEVTVATTPDAWFALLAQWSAQAVRVIREPQNDERIPDRAPVLSAAATAGCSLHAFAEAHDIEPFADKFRRALATLSDDPSARGYHTDLAPEGTLPQAALTMLYAAQIGWVFGGMGSWNEMGLPRRNRAEVQPNLRAIVRGDYAGDL